MTLDGTIIDQIKAHDWRGENLPPSYCPPDGSTLGMPRWSPDGQSYFYLDVSVGTQPYILYVGEAQSNARTKLGEFEYDPEKDLYLPHFEWLGNDHLYYHDRPSLELRIIDINTRRQTVLGRYALFRDFYTPSITLSPDASRMLVQSWTAPEESFLDLITLGPNTHADISAELENNLGIHFDRYIDLLWSADSSRMAIYVKQGDKIAWLILGSQGKIQSFIPPSEADPFGGWATWTPDGENLLIMCNPVSMGHWGKFDLCMVDDQGEMIKKFSFQNYTSFERYAQWSADGSQLYYLSKTRIEVFPAKLRRLDLNTGEDELVAEGLFDYGWTQNSYIDEQYQFTGIKWSPDGEWMILNNSGPQIKLSERDNFTHTTTMLCHPINDCRQMKFGPLIIFGADWWQPPAAPLPPAAPGG